MDEYGFLGWPDPDKWKVHKMKTYKLSNDKDFLFTKKGKIKLDRKWNYEVAGTEFLNNENPLPFVFFWTAIGTSLDPPTSADHFYCSVRVRNYLTYTDI